CMHALDFPWTF
nr:immunoglobulin light chain junction region [Macaca mulatta]MOY14011.1 immunoglobulin light chain junction region [Macaca mulatta]